MTHDDKVEKALHQAFILGIWLKVFNGTLQILGGIALLFTGTLARLAEVFIRDELIENPHSFIAIHLQRALPVFLANSGWFAMVYLWSHGGVKIFLAVGLLRNKLWAYPSAIAIFALFIVYQSYRYAFTHSVFLLALTALDLAVIWLTWHEYRHARKHRSLFTSNISRPHC